ncbi:MAG: hypothetical protein KGJ86_01205 [Chloroflexota bacterium]|nr:hypothetical protein [Chloroflexota bacterium]
MNACACGCGREIAIARFRPRIYATHACAQRQYERRRRQRQIALPSQPAADIRRLEWAPPFRLRMQLLYLKTEITWDVHTVAGLESLIAALSANELGPVAITDAERVDFEAAA